MNQKHVTLFLFTILVGVFSTLGVVMYTGIEETGEKKVWEVHTVQVKEMVNQLLHHNYNQESANRGYALTADSLFVIDVNKNQDEIKTVLTNLQALVKENVSQSKRVRKLKRLSFEKFIYIDSLRMLIEDKVSKEEVREVLMINEKISNEIDEYCYLMLEEENALLKMREKEFAEELYDNKKSLLTLVLALMLVLIGVTIFLIRIFNQISAAKKEVEVRNAILEETKNNLIESNQSLNLLSTRFDSSLSKSKMAAFDWPDTSQEYFWLSDSMFDILGLKKNEFVPNVSAFFGKLMHPDDITHVQKELDNHLKTGAVYAPEYRLKKADGDYLYFRALGTSSTENGVQSMTGVILDIEREIEVRNLKEIADYKMKEYSLRFNLVLKSSRYGVWDWYDITDPNQWWSDTFYELLDYSPSEIDPTVDNFHKLVHPDDLELSRKAMEDNINVGTKINVEYRLKTKNHGYKWFRAVGDRIIDENEPNRIRMIGVVSDISKEKLFSEELKRSNADLQDFAYVASHDLQEPLRKIQAFGDRLQMAIEKEHPDFSGNVYVEKMNSSATRMRRLIDDLLNFSRVSGESSFTETVNLNEVLIDVKSLLSETIESSGATVHISELPTLHQANRGNLVQLFLNLINNALKFRKKDTPSVVEVTSTSIGMNEAIKFSPHLIAHERYFKIEIKDNGIGFDETYLTKIFTIFQRLHGKSEFKGTGIGLAVCQKICENHEGIITAVSQLGEGSTFIVILPEINKENE